MRKLLNRVVHRAGKARSSRARLFFSCALLLFLIGVTAPVTTWASTEAHGGGEGAGKEPELTGPQFVRIGPLHIPILRDGRVMQSLMLVVALEVDGGENMKTVEGYTPLLKDAYLSALYGSIHTRGADQGGLVDVTFIRTKLETATARVVPAGLVKNVLLQQVEQR